MSCYTQGPPQQRKGGYYQYRTPKKAVKLELLFL